MWQAGQQESGMRSKRKLDQPAFMMRNLVTIWHRGAISGHQEPIGLLPFQNTSSALFIEVKLKRSCSDKSYKLGRRATTGETAKSGGRVKVGDFKAVQWQEERSQRFDPKAAQYLGIKGVLLMELRHWAAHHHCEEGPRCDEDWTPRCHLNPPLPCRLVKETISNKKRLKLGGKKI